MNYAFFELYFILGWGRGIPLSERSGSIPTNSDSHRNYPHGLSPALQYWDEDTPANDPYLSRYPSAYNYGPLSDSFDESGMPPMRMPPYDPRLDILQQGHTGPSQAYRSPGLYDTSLDRGKNLALMELFANKYNLPNKRKRVAQREKRESVVDPAMIASLGKG